MSIRVRAAADLVGLVGTDEVHVEPTGRRSVKDLVEAVGIPHPEIGLLVVDGTTVGFGHQIHDGELVEVYPPDHGRVDGSSTSLWPEPPEPRRFVLDVHLGTLARRLRLLGFDSWYRTDTDDATLATIAVDEGRILLTRDRKLLMRRELVHGYVPRSDDPETQAVEVVARYRLAERRAPLTRCARCNGELTPVAKAEIVDRLPPRTRREFDTFARCGSCAQVYWPGSHLEAIEGFLDRVASLDAG